MKETHETPQLATCRVRDLGTPSPKWEITIKPLSPFRAQGRVGGVGMQQGNKTFLIQ